MKKCTSCTKDLPDAALHCVFCGAKQAAAPAAPAPNNAKTVMGYSANEMIEQLRASGQLPPGTPGAPGAPKPAAAPPTPMPAPTPAPTPYAAAPVASTLVAPQAASPFASPAVPQAQAQAKTMFASGPPPGVVPAAQQQPQHDPLDVATVLVGSLQQQSAPAPQGVGMLATLAAPPPTGNALAPASSAAAKTMVPEGMLSPFANQQQPQPQPMRPPEPEQPMSRVHTGGGGFPSMIPPAPVGPVPTVQPMFQNNNAGGGYSMPGQQNPYGAPAPTMGSPGRPIDPWKQGLRLMMFIFGGLLAIAFVLPLSTDPMAFMWDAIIHGGGGKTILLPLWLGGSALIALIAAMVPMPSAVRGAIATVLGLGGIALPLLIENGHDLNWQTLASELGFVLTVVGLLLRSEYHDAVLPRILATIGAVAMLSVYIVPQGELGIPLLSMFRSLTAGGLQFLILGILSLAFLALIVCAFFVWLPAPNGGFPKVVMWLLLAWPVLDFLWGLANHGAGELAHSPAMALSWLTGMGERGGGGGDVAYSVFVAYGAAAMFGKTLE